MVKLVLDSFRSDVLNKANLLENPQLKYIIEAILRDNQVLDDKIQEIEEKLGEINDELEDIKYRGEK